MTELQKTIIRQIQKNKNCSRKDLSKLLGVTPAAITQNTKPLIDSSVVYFLYEKEKKNAGRKEEVLTLGDDAFFSIGIEIDDNVIEYVEINANLGLKKSKNLEKIEDAYKEINKTNLYNCIGITISKRKFQNESSLSEEELAFYNKLKEKIENVTFSNNVSCLAYAYKMFHNDKSFLLIKYGPNIGSSCFIDDECLSTKRKTAFDIGKLLLNENESLEDRISFDYKNESQKKNSYRKLLKDENLRKEIFQDLRFVIKNANILLELDKVILSGEIFSKEELFMEFIETFKENPGNIDITKLVTLDNYEYFRKCKAALTAQYLYFYNK